MYEKWPYISFSISIYTWETGNNPKMLRTTTLLPDVGASVPVMGLQSSITCKGVSCCLRQHLYWELTVSSDLQQKH